MKLLRTALSLLFPLALPLPAQADAGASPEALLKTADEWVARVARIRGLKPKRRVQKGVLGREAIAEKLMARIRKEYAPEEIAIEERVYKRLGLLPPDAHYEKAVMDLLLEQIAGFYDPFDRKLYIADWLSESMQIPTLAHEIAHALQDQRFGLKAYATPIKDNGDRQLARSALVEGDGTAVMVEAMIAFPAAGSLAAAPMPAFDRAPRFLRETLIFPYVQGLAFVQRIRNTHPWSAVDAVYARPPESTEQVIHPEKYFARERPVSVQEGGGPIAKKWRPIRRDVLGEMLTRLYLEGAVAPEQAQVAAEGWGGDRLVAYEIDAGSAPLVVLLSVWDSEADADEFARAANRVHAKMSGKPEGTLPAIYAHDAGEESAIERRGTKVLQLIGAPREIRAQLLEEVWRTWRVAGKPAGVTPTSGRM